MTVPEGSDCLLPSVELLFREGETKPPPFCFLFSFLLSHGLTDAATFAEVHDRAGELESQSSGCRTEKSSPWGPWADGEEERTLKMDL